MTGWREDILPCAGWCDGGPLHGMALDDIRALRRRRCWEHLFERAVEVKIP
jgi:hypothetical protein